MHPKFVGAVIPIGGATATDGTAPMAAWTFRLAKAAVEADPIWQATGGDYYDLPKDQHPVQGNALSLVAALAHWIRSELRPRAGTR